MINTHLNIKNPKRDHSVEGREKWYTYYAGFSSNFVHEIIKSANIKADGYIADPWNGGGTTTTISAYMGYKAKGLDLNPVMAVASKALLVNRLDYPSILPLAKEIIQKAKKKLPYLVQENDPLKIWLKEETVKAFRIIQYTIDYLLIEGMERIDFYKEKNFIDRFSTITSFYYVAIFRTVRKFVNDFFTSNPTWIKRPKNNEDKVLISFKEVLNEFYCQVNQMLDDLKKDSFIDLSNPRVELNIASSESIPWEDSSIDFIVTSPPYCTRIDYAVATMPELAVLNIDFNEEFTLLRSQLIGNTKVSNNRIYPTELWGEECNIFLNKLYNHPSKASKTYYYKNHLQYFDSIYKSIGEISRVMKNNSTCVVVIQDSHYKDILNDLPLIFTEMAETFDLDLVRKENFLANRSLGDINSISKKYRNNSKNTESVLCFQK